jgi:hypothetical protein
LIGVLLADGICRPFLENIVAHSLDNRDGVVFLLCIHVRGEIVAEGRSCVVVNVDESELLYSSEELSSLSSLLLFVCFWVLEVRGLLKPFFLGRDSLGEWCAGVVSN